MSRQDFLLVTSLKSWKEFLTDFLAPVESNLEIHEFRGENGKIYYIYSVIETTVIDLTNTLPYEVEDAVKAYGIVPTFRMEITSTKKDAVSLDTMEELSLSCIYAWLSATEDDLIYSPRMSPELVRKEGKIYIATRYSFWNEERLKKLALPYIELEILNQLDSD